MTFARNAWYCAGFASEITSEPMMRRIVGIPILLIRDDAGTVRAVNSRCPHRFAPLDQGRRVGDTIECPYHGLRFGFDGACVHNPHGSGRIPGAAKVDTYLVVERGYFVWLWPGDPEFADADDIPDLQLVDYGDKTPIHGHLKMPVHYQLVLDNLLDLSHAGYLHAGTLSPARTGNDAKVERQAETEVGEDRIMVRAAIRDTPTPSSQAMYWDGETGDFHSHMEWIFPGTMRHSLSMTEPGAGFGNGAQTRLVHLITPESETSTHYFWMHTRDARADDAEVDRKTRELIEYSFTQEDEPMIRQVQEMMNGEDFFSLKPLYLETDEAGTRCRRIIERRIREEAEDIANRANRSELARA